MARTNLPAQTPQVPADVFVAFDMLYRHVAQLNLGLKTLEGTELTAFRSKISNTTLALDDDFQFKLAPNERKRFEALLWCSGNVKFRFGGPAAPEGMGIETIINDGASTSAYAAVYSAADIVAANFSLIRITGMIYNGPNAGVFGISWAQNTSSATPAGFYSGSVFRHSLVV